MCKFETNDTKCLKGIVSTVEKDYKDDPEYNQKNLDGHGQIQRTYKGLFRKV
ncbi:MAG: hypothetical protein JSV92_03590 [archaeon]|nr:MAG: hypothetical protein JSV92_03590 [archaeon]